MNCSCENEIPSYSAQCLRYGLIYRCNRCQTSYYKGWINKYQPLEVCECWNCIYNELSGEKPTIGYCDLHDKDVKPEECCENWKWMNEYDVPSEEAHQAQEEKEQGQDT